MNIAVDIGNSFSKIGLFNDNLKVDVFRIANSSVSNHIKKIFKKESAPCGLVLSSVGDDKNLIRQLAELAETNPLVVSASVKLPFTIGYQSPESLGSDRIAAIAGAYNKFHESNVLVVDAGTAVTYDILRSDGFWPGGSISPGLTTRYRALKRFTRNLPLVERKETWGITGDDTISAIRSGVQSGLIFEINEYIRNFKIVYKELNVIVTGGDGSFVADNLSHEVTNSPDIVLEGLNHILNYNAEQI